VAAKVGREEHEWIGLRSYKQIAPRVAFNYKIIIKLWERVPFFNCSTKAAYKNKYIQKLKRNLKILIWLPAESLLAHRKKITLI
jgi:hypothetical protein